MRDPVRTTALLILNRLDSGKETLDHLVEAAFEADRTLGPRDRRFLFALVFGVSRWRGLLDWAIGRVSKTPLPQMDPGVRNLLRLAAFQILKMDRVPAAAAVTTAVEISKTIAKPHVTKFVNGVLRGLSRTFDAPPFQDGELNIGKDTVADLSVTRAFPQWLAARWVARFGVEEATALMDALNRFPALTLRVHCLETHVAELTRLLEERGSVVEPGRYAPDAIQVKGGQGAVSEMAGFSEGYFQVQDEAAQLVSLFLSPRPGETVLDACAGLGGKTGHLAALMENRGRLVATDVDAGKLARLEAEMKRLRVGIVTGIETDWDSPRAAGPETSFDRVLVDAPCSGLGTIRRNPDIKWNRVESHLAAYSERQTRLLGRLADRVRPGGVLVYAVCSMEPEETVDVVDRFLETRSDFFLESDGAHLPVAVRPFLDMAGFFRTFPHRDDLDGFFAARLVRALC